MALKSVPGIDLESLPEEARSLIEGTRAEGAGCRPPYMRIGCCGNAPARQAQQVWPKSEKLSAGKIELLELEPGVHAQEVEKESEVASGRKRLTKREHARRNALPEGLPRREEIIAVEGEERLYLCCEEERCRIGFEE
jgi:hypothetical protein